MNNNIYDSGKIFHVNYANQHSTNFQMVYPLTNNQGYSNTVINGIMTSNIPQTYNGSVIFPSRSGYQESEYRFDSFPTAPFINAPVQMEFKQNVIEDNADKILDSISTCRSPIDESIILHNIESLLEINKFTIIVKLIDAYVSNAVLSQDFFEKLLLIFLSNHKKEFDIIYTLLKQKKLLGFKEMYTIISNLCLLSDERSFTFYSDACKIFCPNNLCLYYPLIGYCHSSSNYTKANELYNDILKYNIIPDLHIFSLLMDTSRATYHFLETEMYYEDLIKFNIRPDNTIYRCLLLNYKDAQLIEKAESLFFTLCSSQYTIDVSLYSPLLEIYINNKQPIQILNLITTLLHLGIMIESTYFDQLIPAFVNNPTHFLSIYETMMSLGFIPPSEFYLTLFSSCQSISVWERVYSIFITLKSQNYPFFPCHYSALIKSSGKNFKWNNVVQIYEIYESSNQKNSDPFVQVINSSRILRYYDAGWSLYIKYLKQEKELSIPVFIAVVQLCEKMNNFQKLLKVLGDWEKSRITGNQAFFILLINTMIGFKNYELAEEHVKNLNELTPTEDGVLCLLKYYKWIEKPEKEIELLKKSINLKFDGNQYSIILETCKIYNQYDLGLSYFKKMKEFNIIQTKNIVSTVLSFYKGKRDWTNGKAYFLERKEIEKPNNHLYFSMMALCKEFQEWEYAKLLIDDLFKAGIKPSSSMQSAVLSLYRDCQKYDEAQVLYNDFLNKGKVAPVVHGCMISLLGDQNKFSEAFEIYELIKNSKDEIGNSTYCSLFHNCAKLKDVGKANQLYQDFLKKNIEHNAHIYSSLISVYKSVGNSEKILELINDMKKRKVRPDIYLKSYMDEFHMKY